MVFSIRHRTEYRYSHPASEACLEARLTPPGLPWQEILAHEILVHPEAMRSEFVDPWGNRTVFFSMAARHEVLRVENILRVRTQPRMIPEEALQVSVAEARQLYNSRLFETFDYLQPSRSVPVGGFAKELAKKLFGGSACLGEALGALTSLIHSSFEYRPGATDVFTPLQEVWKRRAGVCQDFAHVALSVLRTAGIPCRYVCGYIEAGGPAALVGSLATHAWVEALLPGGYWAATDPTNNQWCGERHVTVAYGRDFDDAAPVRGTFKGSGQQRLSVKVRMTRLKEKI